MKVITSFLCLFLIQNNFSQPVVKQITDFEFDSKNPAFINYQDDFFNFDSTEIFFEAVEDTSVNIFSMDYNVSEDIFNNPIPITSNNFINRKVVGKHIYNWDLNYNYKIILWETNQNGNWDIAYSIDSGNGWSSEKILFNSDKDELDPSFVQTEWYYGDNPFRLLFSRGNSVYFFSRDTIDTEQLVFEGNDTIKYSDPALSMYDYLNARFTSLSLVAVALRSINDGDPYLVYKIKMENDTLWTEERELFPRAPAVNPKFIMFEFTFTLTFEVLFNGKRKVLIKPVYELESGSPAIELLDDPSLETSDFHNYVFPLVITKKSDLDRYFPYSFRYVRNDSTFIRSGPQDYYWNFNQPFDDFYTKIFESRSSLGVMGYNNGLITYTVWEDSSENGRINLYGIKRINPLGDVEPIERPNGFYLSQNYPNPFNPVTKIKYTIPATQSPLPGGVRGGSTTLKIYDILGNEVATLVNEEKSPGEYEVEFNASKYGLSSGVYFYQLKAGSFLQTKKLILMK